MNRPNLGFGGDEEDGKATSMTPAVDFKPRPKREDLEDARTASKLSAKEQGFQSREPKTHTPQPSAPMVRDRRKRTGRAQSFTTRVSPDFYDRFYAIVDAQELSVCETFEQAIMALEREFANK